MIYFETSCSGSCFAIEHASGVKSSTKRLQPVEFATRSSTVVYGVSMSMELYQQVQVASMEQSEEVKIIGTSE